MRNDRRRAARLRLAFPVLVEGPYGIRRCIARDVSEGGLFIETNEQLEPETDVRVIFSLPDGSWEMATRCVVRHVQRLAPDANAVFGVGLSIVDFDDDAQLAPGPVRRVHA